MGGEKKKSLSARSTILIMVLLMVLFVCCIFGVLYYIQVSNKKEIQLELRTAISKLQQLGQKKVEHNPTMTKRQLSGETNNQENRMTNEHSMPEPTNKGLLLQESSSKSISPLRKPWLNMRLPTSIVPNTYNIDLVIDMDNDFYKGYVTINVLVAQTTNLILIHKVDLLITDITIINVKTSKEINIKKEFSYAPNEFHVIQADTFLRNGEEYDINIKFTGKMGSDLSGFYVSYYNDGNNNKKVASTFFSPISARKAFPCFDEPVFKANFTLTLSHSDKYKARSNMQAASTCRKDNILTTKFLTTLKMSTYILCWVISDYKHIQTADKKISAWTNDVEEIRFGMDMSSKLLSFYEDYFKIPYPLKKLDIVSIPSFGPGAMENWGIITFRSERILVNQKTSTQSDRQKSFYIIAHELVHQWFGNLVTMEFWTDAWLKEGFANNIGAIGGNHVDKTMGSKEQVLSSSMLPALELDSYATSHPISTSVKTPSDIRGVFDMITYNKGSCLVSLLHGYLGDEDFRKGLQRYLNTYAYRNANQDDLWEQLSIVSGKDVKSVMDTWTLQLGYPVISVRRMNQSFVEITQRRFSLDPPNTILPKSPFGYSWKVPLIFKSPTKEETKAYLLTDKSATINIPEDYTILNPDHSLFYRVNYEEKMMHTLNTILVNQPNLLTAQDRTGFISDQFSFVAAKMIDIGRTLELLFYLKGETDYYPWKAALEQLSYINTLITSKDIQMKFDRFIGKLTTDIVRNISWYKTRTVNQGSLQVLLLNQACQSGSDDSDVYIQAGKHYVDWMLGREIKLRASLHPVFRDCAISYGPDLYWNYAYLKYKAKGPGSDSLLWSLTATTKMPTIRKMLNYSLDTDQVDTQYAPYVISELSKRNQNTRKLCWQFIKENWKIIIKRYGNELFMLSDMLSAVLDSFSTEEDLRDIVTFFSNKNIGSGANAVKQAIHKIEGNILWKRNNFDNLVKWLEKQGF